MDRWVEIEGRLVAIETWVEEMRQNHLPHINQRLDWIYERLNRGYRPPWNVVLMISTLSSACVGLLVALMRR